MPTNAAVAVLPLSQAAASQGVPEATVLDACPALQAWVGPDLVVRYLNRACERWFRRPREVLLGLPMAEVLGQELYALSEPHLAAAMAGEPRQFHRAAVLPDGRQVHAQSDYTPHVVDGRIVGVHVSVTDITRHVIAKANVQEALTRGALHEDRARIAADLHDRVVQQLFAAGLGLNRALKTSDETGAEIIRNALELLDSAITDLRVSIHELHRDVDATSVRSLIEQVVADASRSLGWAIDLQAADCPEELPPTIAQEVLAVLTEALSNVVKHAHASVVAVHVSSGSAGLHVYVEDDGVGVGEQGRRSGLANMRTRAERLGGTFELLALRPHGTAVSWRVPLPDDTPHLPD